MDKSRLRIFAAALVLLAPIPASAGILLVDFESFPDSTSLSAQIPGLAFTNATIIAAGISLNEFEFPPHSGGNVAFDDGGPISMMFSAPVTSFSAYFTYTTSITLRAFDISTNQVASITSLFSGNLALSGDPGSSPNELRQLVFAGGISRVTITGDPFGGSFVMDDATITSAVPEPNTASLIWGALALGAILVRVARLTTLHSLYCLNELLPFSRADRSGPFSRDRSLSMGPFQHSFAIPSRMSVVSCPSVSYTVLIVPDKTDLTEITNVSST